MKTFIARMSTNAADFFIDITVTDAPVARLYRAGIYGGVWADFVESAARRGDNVILIDSNGERTLMAGDVGQLDQDTLRKTAAS